jgi:amino acid adenylation domain-containing protein
VTVAQVRSVTSLLDVLAARFAVADPGAVAVSAGGDGVGWQELDRWSWAVAARLAAARIGPGDYVPVIAARGAALVAGWLGALRRGAAYAPLGLDTPPQRLEHILTELAARTVVADRAGAALLEGLIPGRELVRIEEHRDVPARAPVEAVPLTGAEPAVVIYTSGTTGRPKGVVVPHRGMLNTVLWWADDVGLGPADRLLCVWATSFDGATHEVFRSLVAGSELVFADDVERRDPRALGRLLRGPHGATVTSMTPSLLRAVLNADTGERTTLRVLYVGGEGLPRSLAEECRRRWGVPLRNIYGPTEASCISTWCPVDLDDGQEPAIGVPLPNTRAYVLGPRQEELPAGTPGELYVAGVGVALAYLGQPERTAAAFLPDRYDADPAARMYRTGDRAVLRPDGLLEHLGRIDDQVKVLGNRIEPNEVRKLLEEQPAIRSAAVQAVGEPRRLIAYVQLSAGPGSTVDPLPTRDEVVRPLLDWLPAAVLPAEVLVVDALPMTPNDKVDLEALAVMRSQRLPDAAAQPLELTAGQRRAAELFAAVLDGAAPGPAVPDGNGDGGGPRRLAGLRPDADFFTVGGHSLLAVTMLSEAERRGWGRVPLREFLADSTVAGLGRLLGAAASEPGPAGADDADRFPATPVQQRLWFLDRLASLRTAYLVPAVVELTGPVDAVALQQATQAVLGDHPALRSRFSLDRQLRRVLYRTDGPAPVVTRVDASGWTDREVRERLAPACWAPFDLATDAPARAEVITTADTTLLVLAAHHIVTDGASQELLLAQIAARYRAWSQGVPARPAKAVHPNRLALPPDRTLDDRIAAAVSRLRGAPTDVALPHDRPRPGVQPIRAATHTTTLGARLTGRLRTATRELGVTPFMLTAALLAVTLARRCGQRDFLFAFPWAGRDRLEAADAVGMFVNTLVLRADLRGDPTWHELLLRTREECLACYRGADVPFDALAAALHPDRDLSRPPLTPVYLSAVDGAPVPPSLGPGVVSRYLPLDPLYLKYEIELTATDQGDDLELAVCYASDLFDAPTIAGLADALVASALDAAADLHARPLKGAR